MNKNKFAVTPPMGWNSYDYYDTTVSEADVKRNADYMEEHMKEFGWEYIVVDIEWYSHEPGTQRDKYQYIPFWGMEMDEYGRLLPDPARFPSSVDGAGFKPLADYIHSKGLKFGIHIMRGIPRIAAHNHMKIYGSSATANEIADPSSICKWNPDMYGVRYGVEGAQEYYNSILELYASWGVDYIKCDDICNTNAYPHAPYSGEKEIEMLQAAIQNCGREIVLSLSPGPALINKAWHYEKYANMWRITDDFWDNWESLMHMFERCEVWQNHVSEGCYPDCDMLPFGTLGKGFGHERQTNFTHCEQQVVMTLWCIFGSPLMLGAEMPKMDEWTLNLLTNRDVLEMLTPDCKAMQVYRNKDGALWCANNVGTGKSYVAVFNFKEEDAQIGVSLEELWQQGYLMEGKNDKADAIEAWSHEAVAVTSGEIAANVEAHGVKLFVL